MLELYEIDDATFINLNQVTRVTIFGNGRIVQIFLPDSQPPIVIEEKDKMSEFLKKVGAISK